MNLFQLVKYQPLLQPWALDIAARPVQKQTYVSDFISNKDLINVHHNDSNSHIPGINFFEFFGIYFFNNKLSLLIVNVQSMPGKVMLYLQKIPSIYC